MKTEKAIGIVCLVGILFKMFHWNGGDFILIISLSMLSLLYFPLAFYFFSDKTISNQNLPLSIMAGLCLSMIPVGAMFKLMHWNGGQWYVWVSILVTLPLLLIVVGLKRKQEHLLTYYNRMLVRISILGTIAVITYMLPLK